MAPIGFGRRGQCLATAVRAHLATVIRRVSISLQDRTCGDVNSFIRWLPLENVMLCSRSAWFACQIRVSNFAAGSVYSQNVSGPPQITLYCLGENEKIYIKVQVTQRAVTPMLQLLPRLPASQPFRLGVADPMSWSSPWTCYKSKDL